MNYRAIETFLLFIVAVATSSCGPGRFVERGEVHQTEHYLWIENRDGLFYWEKGSPLELHLLDDVSGIGEIFEEEDSVWFKTVDGVYRWGKEDGEGLKLFSGLHRLIWLEEKGDSVWTVSARKICKWETLSYPSSHCIDNPARIVQLMATSEFAWLIASDWSTFSWRKETLSEPKLVKGFSGDIKAVAEISPRVWLAGSDGLFILDDVDRSRAARVEGPGEVLAIKERGKSIWVLAMNGIYEFSRGVPESNVRVEKEYAGKGAAETPDSFWLFGYRELIRWPKADAEDYEEYSIMGAVSHVVEADDFYWAYDFMKIFNSPVRDGERFTFVAGLKAISTVYPVSEGVWVGTRHGMAYWHVKGGLRKTTITGNRFSLFEVGDYLLIVGAELDFVGDVFVTSGHRLSVVERNSAELLTSMRFPYGWLSYAALDGQTLWLFTSKGLVEMDPLKLEP